MTNIRPSSTFVSVPRYTSSYIKRENCSFEDGQKFIGKDPDPIQSEINFFKSDINKRKDALKEKIKISEKFHQMYNSTIPTQMNGSKTLLISPKQRRKEVRILLMNSLARGV